MLIIPAIDLKDGRCVRLRQGVFEDVDTYDGDPVEYALRWRSAGAQFLHVVDLDGARLGEPQPANVEALQRIASQAGVPVEMGGGVRTMDTAERILAAGVKRVVVGTSVARDDGLAAELFHRFGERVVVGIDARDGYVAVRGWQEVLAERAVDMAARMVRLGARRVIFTDIGRDGMLSGVNVQALAGVLQAAGVPVIASGGVTTVADIRALRQLESPNLEGAIVGKALYEGRLDLREAIAAAS